MSNSFKFDLVGNAVDSLNHAVEHIKNKPTHSDLKQAIGDVAHAAELLLKERLRRIHPVFVFKNIDKFPDLNAETVSTDLAILRLIEIGGVKLSEHHKQAVADGRKIRNRIEHYEVEIEVNETKVLIGRFLSFIVDFSSRELKLEILDMLGPESNDALLSIKEFWEEYSKDLSKKLQEGNVSVERCLKCDANTYDTKNEYCHCCKSHFEIFHCQKCKLSFVENQGHLGIGGFICNLCFEKAIEELV